MSTGFDSGLNQNAGEYEAMAKELATELGIFQSPVKSVAYEGQGTTNNDPDIFLLLTSESGERAQLMFSRHDKALLAITYDIGMRERDVAHRNEADFDRRAEEFFKNNPDATTYSE